MNKAVFLDRDGVINNVIFRNGNNLKPIAPWSMKEFSLILGIEEPLLDLSKSGFKLFIVTNQPDIGNGIISKTFVEKVNKIILRDLPIDEIKVCPHVDLNGCNCRKPKSGMITSLAKKWDIDCKKSFMIGDNWKDIESGKNAGATTILLEKHYNTSVKGDYTASNLSQAVEIINQISS
jgi:D-glycero-D-manno-heptose 1,7-bisphosphate phosphatase